MDTLSREMRSPSLPFRFIRFFTVFLRGLPSITFTRDPARRPGRKLFINGHTIHLD